MAPYQAGMATADESALVIGLSGPGWQAALAVTPPAGPARPAGFDVPSLGAEHTPLLRITADVLYTEAVNRLPAGWDNWHVKIYHCATQGDAEALRRYLRRQAVAIQQANAGLDGPSRIPIDPPWAVVPVQIVRGDGRQEVLGRTVRTELGVPPDQVIDQVPVTLPSWFQDRRPHPELYLLAVSPRVEPLRWAAVRHRPGTEQLAGFTDLAAGLDTLHRLGWAHCDIKPDNVCRYGTDGGSRYVLIDTDAATQLDPAPVSLRNTPLYEYGGVRAWRTGQVGSGGGVDPRLLRAQDRFGFALVVLTALAGRDWVEQTLLSPAEDDQDGRRPADNRDAVVAALRRTWRDTGDRRWEPLIQVLAEPFPAPGPAEPAIEAPGWQTRGWVDRLLRVEQDCVVGAGAARRTAPMPRGPADRFAPELARIRRQAMSPPAPRARLVQQGYAALAGRAQAVAMREAVRSMLAWATGIVLLLVLGALVAGALGWGK